MISKIQLNDQIKKIKNKKDKKFNSDNLKRLLDNDSHIQQEDDVSNNDVITSDYDFGMLDEKIPADQIDYNMKKPGAHAKAGEWRKWKMMQRAIRQQREEIKLIKAQQKNEMETIEIIDSNLTFCTAKQSPRNYTLSIAIPSSAIDKILLRELRTCFAGQIARAATLFCVDEIIVYNEYSTVETDIQKQNYQQFIKILEYLECPQYLRKTLFPPHKYLEHVGLLSPLEATHHFKINDEWDFREGVVTDIPCKENKGSWVDIGLRNKIQVDKKLHTGIRVTVKKIPSKSEKLVGVVVSPETPRQENGLYWGYQVRYANSFKKIFQESCFKEKYNLKIGVNNKNLYFDNIRDLPKARRILFVYGGANGLEAGIESDEKLKANKLEDIFDFVCQSEKKEDFQIYGSRSLRLEEALLISLSTLKPKIIEAHKDIQNNLEEKCVKIDEFSNSQEENSKKLNEDDVKEN